MTTSESAAERESSTRRPRTTPWLAIALWALCVATSFVAIAVYAKTSGPGANPPAFWPLAHSNGDSDGWRLVMAIHPRCPCSRASITQLQQLLEGHTGELWTDIYVYRPQGEAPAWSDTSLVDRAGRLPSVRVHDDPDGATAAQFGIETSGGAVLYSPEGVAVYHGGITASRGHEGANAGQAAIEDALAGRAPTSESRPVYGCPLSLGSGEGP